MNIARLSRRALVCAVAAGALLAARPAGATVSVCIDSSNPAHAMDQRVVEAVAHQQGTDAAIYQFDGSGAGDDDGFDVKRFSTLAASRCALVLGFPVDATHGAVPEGMRATAPYARMGFVLVTPRSQNAETLADLPRGTDVAVTYLTAPNLYFVKHPNIQADIYPTDAQTIASVVHHTNRAAMVWRASAVAYLPGGEKARDYCLHALSEPHADWNVVALYGPGGATAAAEFQKSVETLRRSGQLAALLRPYAMSPASPIVLAAAETPAAAPAAGGEKPALFTAAQADAGKKAYADNCAQCHGDNLEGMAGPALKGKNFASPKANFHVGDIFTIVSQNMPATQPASLPHDVYVNIMAFLLQQNGMPAGSTALTFDGAKSSTVPLVYSGD
ncbi:c-type cytochrome [Gluconacetobacter sacchari]|uniref:C-type cytochrome n=2 Tax=Gluconacetobacter sacchari TaxID=92759 RepID=A0A7W4I9C0_9PROT|nr:c-type cytochrome [Gluconacetobacter sacchari]MBB2158680.1 c-type cytochrome [Gluconacetobacter sacchari]